jgi:hypothetical protein
MKRKRTRTEEPPAGIPETPRPVPDVEIPPMDPDLWGGEGGGGAYPGGPTGKVKKPQRKGQRSP